ncbi:MAG: hypothetical protein NWF01_11025 [Candidatus Bathyarchaeota archaeon]|nr:hypothetical protein [Candidatus Bathyarchaeota archaeon]
MKKKACAGLAFILLFGLFFTGISSFNCASGAVSVNGIISSDTTWTKADSPYSLSGNVLVDLGATLTIDAGATVNLNGYYIKVNGTLQAHGSSSERITFTGSGYVQFTEYSTSWDETTGSGCIIEKADFDQGFISTDSAPKIIYCSMTRLVAAGSPTITNNTIVNDLSCCSGDGTNPVIANNTVQGLLTIPYHCAYPSGTIKITNNTLIGGIQADYKRGTIDISYNTISGKITTGTQYPTEGLITFSHNTISCEVSLSGLTVFSFNMVTKEVDIFGSNNTITNNTLVGNGNLADNTVGIILSQAGILFCQNNTVTNNVISGFTNGICVGIYQEGSLAGFEIEGNLVPFIGGNNISNCQYGINARGSALITDNVVTNNYCGIDAHCKGAIEYNQVTNNYYGMSHASAVNYNTIAHNVYGITGGGSTLQYNNIYNNTQYNLDLGSNNTWKGIGRSTFDTPNNWWGTTDTNTIDQSIYDYYEDFDLAKVNYTPILTAANTQAVPRPVTVPTWTPTPTTSPTPTATPPPTTSNPTATPTQPSGTGDNSGFNWDSIALPLIAGVIVGIVLAIVIIFFVRGKASPKPF